MQKHGNQFMVRYAEKGRTLIRYFRTAETAQAFEDSLKPATVLLEESTPEPPPEEPCEPGSPRLTTAAAKLLDGADVDPATIPHRGDVVTVADVRAWLDADAGVD